MSEDTLNTGTTPENTEQPNTVTEPQYTEVEQRAMDMGWVPKDKYSGDPERWKSAEVFVALDEPIRKIEQQSSELKSMRKALEALREHYGKVQETEYKRALESLKASKREAMENGDFAKVNELDDKIDEFREEAKSIKNTIPAVEDAPQVAPEFAAWVRKNEWYQSQKHMAAYADEVGARLVAQGVSKYEVLKRVEEEVRKEFPNKFRNPNKDTAADLVNGSNKQGSSGKGKPELELSETERTIMNTLVRGGHITKEKYIADLRRAKGIE
jgi:hypothetical protein